MAKVFIILALVFTLGTVGLGVAAKGKVDKLQSVLKETKGDLGRTKTKLSATEADLKKTQEELGATKSTLEETTKNLETTKTELATTTSQRDLAKMEVEAKAAEVAKLQKDLEIALKPPTDGGPVNPVIQQLTDNLQKAQAELNEKKTIVVQLDQQVKQTGEKLAALEKKERDRALEFGKAGLQARILAVNPGWNFVVLSVGDKQGVAVNAPLLVVRGNEPVARLRISSVENTTSIADVIPGSVRRGITVQPGDTVIFEGRASTTQVPQPSSGDAAAPALPR